MVTLILFDLSANILYHGKHKSKNTVNALLLLIPVESLILYVGGFWKIIEWPQVTLFMLYVASIAIYVFYRKGNNAVFNAYTTFVTQTTLIFLYYAGRFFG